MCACVCVCVCVCVSCVRAERLPAPAALARFISALSVVQVQGPPTISHLTSGGPPPPPPHKPRVGLLSPPCSPDQAVSQITHRCHAPSPLLHLCCTTQRYSATDAVCASGCACVCRGKRMRGAGALGAGQGPHRHTAPHTAQHHGNLFDRRPRPASPCPHHTHPTPNTRRITPSAHTIRAPPAPSLPIQCPPPSPALHCRSPPPLPSLDCL